MDRCPISLSGRLPMLRPKSSAPQAGKVGIVNRQGIRHLIVVCIAAFALVACFAATAQAGPLVGSAPACSSGGSQVFQPWLDPASYVLDAGGAFEDGGAGWSLDGASVVSGNEPYNVHGGG